MTGLRCIALLGPRGAGKSTIGKALGPALGWPVVDTDELIAARVGCSAGAYLARAGEPAFRHVEEVVCRWALGPGEPRVVALGGGAVLTGGVRRRLQRPSVLAVFVEAPAPVLAERLRAARISRPSLTGARPDDEVADVLAARRPLYEQLSRMRINTNSSNVDACVAQILDKMGRVP